MADYTKAIRLDPKYSAAYNNRGVVYHQKGELSKAMADYTRAIDNDAGNAVALRNRGDAHYQAKAYDPAIRDCTAAVNLDPFLIDAWKYRGWSLVAQKEYERAVRNFNEAVSFQVFGDTQEDVDRYWDALGAGGDPQAQQCGWLKDRYGLCWQVIPRGLPELLSDPDDPRSQRAMNAMLRMKKLDMAALQRAYDGEPGA